ncbi:hypothetical protein FQR65_LT20201 [Abscondita terminalis]|nr:hypothetical protein FQR65_LT20201 [Abscondita terminalis]
MSKQRIDVIYKISSMSQVVEKTSISKVDKEAQRKEAARQRELSRPIRKNIEKIESQIGKIQPRLVEIEESLADSELYEANRKDDLLKLMNEQTELKTKLEQAEEQMLEARGVLDIGWLVKPLGRGTGGAESTACGGCPLEAIQPQAPPMQGRASNSIRSCSPHAVRVLSVAPARKVKQDKAQSVPRYVPAKKRSRRFHPQSGCADTFNESSGYGIRETLASAAPANWGDGDVGPPTTAATLPLSRPARPQQRYNELNCPRQQRKEVRNAGRRQGSGLPGCLISQGSAWKP